MGLVPQILQKFHGHAPESVWHWIEAGNPRGILPVDASRPGPVRVDDLQILSDPVFLLRLEIKAAERNILRVGDLFAWTFFRRAPDPNRQGQPVSARFAAFAIA